MNMQQIEYILVLAEDKSFSKAAEHLYMTQSALSQYVRKLEQQLGITLFNRSKSMITLTPEGELYVEAMKRVKSNMQDFQQQLADLSNLKSGRLAIGTSSFRATNLMSQVIHEFHNRYPGIYIHLVTGDAGQLKEKMLAGELDFCIENDSFEKDLFHCEPLYTETHYLAVPKDDPLNNQYNDAIITVDDITHETSHLFEAPSLSLDTLNLNKFICVTPTNSFHKCHKDMFKEAGIRPEKLIYIDNIETAFRWTETGIAPSLIPDSLIIHGNYARHPNYYKLDLVHANQEIVFAMRNGRYVSVAVRKFLDILRTMIGYGTWNQPM